MIIASMRSISPSSKNMSLASQKLQLNDKMWITEKTLQSHLRNLHFSDKSLSLLQVRPPSVPICCQIGQKMEGRKIVWSA